MLKEISQAGNGMYFFIDTNEKISKSFAMCIRGLLSTVGQQDVSLLLILEISQCHFCACLVRIVSGIFSANNAGIL